jgi:uncharacterized membrane protein
VVDEVSKFGGTVLRSNLTKEQELKLQATLEHGAAKVSEVAAAHL